MAQSRSLQEPHWLPLRLGFACYFYGAQSCKREWHKNARTKSMKKRRRRISPQVEPAISATGCSLQLLGSPTCTCNLLKTLFMSTLKILSKFSRLLTDRQSCKPSRTHPGKRSIPLQAGVSYLQPYLGRKMNGTGREGGTEKCGAQKRSTVNFCRIVLNNFVPEFQKGTSCAASAVAGG